MLKFFPIYLSPEVLRFLFVFCFFALKHILLQTVIKFLAVCPKELILVVLVMSFPVCI